MGSNTPELIIPKVMVQAKNVLPLLIDGRAAGRH